MHNRFISLRDQVFDPTVVLLQRLTTLNRSAVARTAERHFRLSSGLYRPCTQVSTSKQQAGIVILSASSSASGATGRSTASRIAYRSGSGHGQRQSQKKAE